MYAIVENGKVINVVEWDGRAETWSPPAGSTAMAVVDGQVPHIGLGYSNGEFEQPPYVAFDAGIS